MPLPSFLSPLVCFALFFVLLVVGALGVGAILYGGSFWLWMPVATVGGVGCWVFAILGTVRRADA